GGVRAGGGGEGRACAGGGGRGGRGRGAGGRRRGRAGRGGGGAPGAPPPLLPRRVQGLDRRHEVLVTGDQHGRVERVVGGELDQIGHQPRVHALLRRVLVGGATRRAPTAPSHSRLALDEVSRTQLEALQESFHHGRRIPGDAHVVVRAGERGRRSAHRLRDPASQLVVVDAKAFVEAEHPPLKIFPA